MSRYHVQGQSGVALMPLPVLVFRVERMHICSKSRVWLQHGDDHNLSEFANQAADKLRVQGFTVRVRPVLSAS